MTWTLLFLIISLALNAVLAYLLNGFIRRLIQAERIMNDVWDAVENLQQYCAALKKQSIAYHSPEVIQFHMLVSRIASSMAPSEEVQDG